MQLHPLHTSYSPPSLVLQYSAPPLPPRCGHWATCEVITGHGNWFLRSCSSTAQAPHQAPYHSPLMSPVLSLVMLGGKDRTAFSSCPSIQLRWFLDCNILQRRQSPPTFGPRQDSCRHRCALCPTGYAV